MSRPRTASSTWPPTSASADHLPAPGQGRGLAALRAAAARPAGGGETGDGGGGARFFFTSPVTSAPPPERGRVGVGVIAEIQETHRPPAAGDLPLAGGGERERVAGGGNGEIVARLARRRATASSQPVEAMRARMQSEPQKPADADVTARTLARLTATLRDLQHMQARACRNPPDPKPDDI